MNSLVILSNTLSPIIWISLGAVFFTTGDVLFRFWYQAPSTTYFIIALLAVTIGMFFLSMSFPHQNIAVATVISILINISLYLIAAFFIFGDVLTIKEGVGLLLGFTAIYILEGMK